MPNRLKINTLKFLSIILVFLNLSCVTSIKDTRYCDAWEEARSGNIDFAFMKLNNYLREYPGTIHTKEIRFAICEYYFQIKDYRDAVYKLSEYIKDYPDDKTAIFAQALLYKIILEDNQQPHLIEKMKESFFSKSLFLIFSESKIKSYNSILNNTYEIADYVDKIEIFKNNDLFLKITP